MEKVITIFFLFVFVALYVQEINERFTISVKLQSGKIGL